MNLNLLYKLQTIINDTERNVSSFFSSNKYKLNKNPGVNLDDIHDRVSKIINRQASTSPKITVITPSTGSETLARAIQSVVQQDTNDILHLIVADGEDCSSNISKITNSFNSEYCKTLTLPFNTGRFGMNGHRIYAAIPFLINSEFVFFLDEDNWYEPNHISSLTKLIEFEDLEWGYSMRNIYTFDEKFVVPDNCESIGDYTPYSNQAPLVDTNCYAFRRETLVKSSHYWYHPLKADRYFFRLIKNTSPKYRSSQKYTVNYRLKQSRPLFPEYFLQGNQFMLRKYNDKLPWMAY